MKGLKGKVAIITGGAGGFGKAVALKLASYGVNIALSDIVLEGMKETVEAIQALGSRAMAAESDVTQLESMEQLVDTVSKAFGTIDILVNNAGITRDNLLIRMKEEEWDTVLAVNLKGTFNGTKAVARTMMKQRSGRIINIASVVGVMGNAGQANYAASKAGIIGLTKTTAKELAPRGITANAIAPGFFETKMTEELPDSAKEAFLKAIPLRRAGKPEDVADVVAFLASDSAAYITGQVIHIDGGMVM